MRENLLAKAAGTPEATAPTTSGSRSTLRATANVAAAEEARPPGNPV